MGFFTILLIGIGLSMDACAVSVTNGMSIKNIKIIEALKIALFFGAFQAIMPLIGFLTGKVLTDFITDFDHWIAFFLLSIIGGKMIYESSKGDKEKEKLSSLKIYILFMLAIATSIDALAVGVTFAFLQVKIIYAISIIGITTLILSFTSIFIGKIAGNFCGNKVEILGGIILIGIGTKILIEHILE